MRKFDRPQAYAKPVQSTEGDVERSPWGDDTYLHPIPTMHQTLAHPIFPQDISRSEAFPLSISKRVSVTYSKSKNSVPQYELKPTAQQTKQSVRYNIFCDQVENK